MAVHRIKVKSPHRKLLYDQLTLALRKAQEKSDVAVEAHIFVSGPASAYANVWEWGNIRQTQPGPKTTLGVNPNGERVFLTIQAPRGYIRVLSPVFRGIIRKYVDRVKISKELEFDRSILKNIAYWIAEDMRDAIKEVAPVDTGELRDNLQIQVEAYRAEVG